MDENADVTPMRSEKPWLSSDQWLGGIARSDGTRQLFVHWLSAVVWNLFGAALVYALWSQGWESFPVLLRWLLVAFIAMGVPILLAALVYTARIARFRNLRLELDPFPGSIGGQVGGTIDLPVRRGVDIDARVTLHCIRSYMRGSGENRSRREDVVWSAQAPPALERSGTGTRLAFTFDVPDEDLPESELEDIREPEDYHYWSIHVAGDLPGADLDQTFEVPVFRVEPALTASRQHTAPETSTRASTERGVDLERLADGFRVTYRRRRYGLAPLWLLGFGLVTVTSGVFVFTQTGGRGLGAFGMLFGGIFLVVFGLVGLLCLALGGSMLLSHRVVEVSSGGIRSAHSFVLGRSVRDVSLDDIDRITAKVTMQSGQGSRARTSYTVYAHLRSGRRLVLGDGIQGAHLLDQLREAIEAETRIGVEVGLRRR